VVEREGWLFSGWSGTKLGYDFFSNPEVVSGGKFGFTALRRVDETLAFRRSSMTVTGCFARRRQDHDVLVALFPALDRGCGG